MPIVPVEHCEERNHGFKLSDLEPGCLSRQLIAVPPLLPQLDLLTGKLAPSDCFMEAIADAPCRKGARTTQQPENLATPLKTRDPNEGQKIASRTKYWELCF